MEVRYVKAFRLHHGDRTIFAWHNTTLKPQLKRNIWRGRLCVSCSEQRRKRDTHREGDDGLTGEKLSKRIQAESSCEDLTILMGSIKQLEMVNSGQAHVYPWMCVKVRGIQRLGHLNLSSTARPVLPGLFKITSQCISDA